MDHGRRQARYQRAWLEQRDIAYVLATTRNDTLITTVGNKRQADELVTALSPGSWRRLSVGAGGHGPRLYDWARVPLGTDWPAGRGRWLLARRSISHPSGIVYYLAYDPRRARLLDLAWNAGSWWHVEECFQQAKNEAGLDHYQARSWRAWYTQHHPVPAGPGMAGRIENPSHTSTFSTSEQA